MRQGSVPQMGGQLIGNQPMAYLEWPHPFLISIGSILCGQKIARLRFTQYKS
jgi:hypothetical protein